jgi:TRAP transporter TAXI family solute receptor
MAPQSLTLATGAAGGVYLPYGTAVAKVLSEKVPGLTVTAVATGASIDNLKMIHQGRADLALTLADTLAEAVAGTGPFAETGKVNVTSLVMLYTNFTHIVVRRDSGITQVADLKGRVVSTGAPGSGTELIADRILAAAGLNPRSDVTRKAFGAADASAALKAGTIDAWFLSGGLGTPAIRDLAANTDFAMALVPNGHLHTALQAKYGAGLYQEYALPEGSYRGLTTPTSVIGVTNVLVAAGRLDPAITEAITATLFDSNSVLSAAHPEARPLAWPSGPNVAPAPFHPGAIKYYKAHAWR